MHGPCGEELRQGDGAEGGMGSAESELLRGEVECAYVADVGRAELGEFFIEQLGERLACTVALLGEAIQRLEGAALAVGEDHLSAGHPVDALAVVQMANHLGRRSRCWGLRFRGSRVRGDRGEGCRGRQACG